MSPSMRTVTTRCSRLMVFSSPVITMATCWLRVVMSPVAETSTNKGDKTSSRPYWSCWLMALDQESSIFWNSRSSGLSADVTLGWAEVEAGDGLWAAAAQHERRTAEMQNANRVIRGRTPYSDDRATKMIALGLRSQAGWEQQKRFEPQHSSDSVQTDAPAWSPVSATADCALICSMLRHLGR